MVLKVKHTKKETTWWWCVNTHTRRYFKSNVYINILDKIIIKRRQRVHILVHKSVHAVIASENVFLVLPLALWELTYVSNMNACAIMHRSGIYYMWIRAHVLCMYIFSIIRSLAFPNCAKERGNGGDSEKCVSTYCLYLVFEWYCVFF